MHDVHKLIHHAGIGKVIIVDGGFGGENESGILRHTELTSKGQMGPKTHDFSRWF